MASMAYAERALKKAGMEPRWGDGNSQEKNLLWARYRNMIVEVYGSNGRIVAINVRRDGDVDDPAADYFAGSYADNMAQAIRWAKEW